MPTAAAACHPGAATTDAPIALHAVEPAAPGAQTPAQAFSTAADTQNSALGAAASDAPAALFAAEPAASKAQSTADAAPATTGAAGEPKLARSAAATDAPKALVTVEPAAPKAKPAAPASITLPAPLLSPLSLPLPASSDEEETQESSCEDSCEDDAVQKRRLLFPVFSRRHSTQMPPMSLNSKKSLRRRDAQAKKNRSLPSIQKQACIRAFLSRQVKEPMGDGPHQTQEL